MSKKVASSKRTTVKKPFPRAKISRLVAEVLGPQAAFTLKISDTALKTGKVVRVITNAWKRDRTAERIERLARAVRKNLTDEEDQMVFRFSMLTPAEFDSVMGKTPGAKAGSRKKEASGTSLKQPV